MCGYAFGPFDAASAVVGSSSVVVAFTDNAIALQGVAPLPDGASAEPPKQPTCEACTAACVGQQHQPPTGRNSAAGRTTKSRLLNIVIDQPVR